MKTAIILLIVALLSGVCTSIYGDWYNPSWSNRKLITFDYTKVSGATLTDFPALVAITDISIQANAQSDGDDILFTAGDETTKLDHQIEYYDSVTGTLRAWVKIPALSHLADTNIYLYYGNPSVGNQANPSAVWSSGYQAVWHMADTSSPATNSVSGSYSGVDTNGVSFGATGIIGAAVSFDGVDDYLDFGDVLDMGTNNRTASVWFKTSSAVGALFGKSLLGQAAGRWTVVYEDGSLYSIFQGIDGLNNWRLLAWTNPNFTDNSWHNLTIVYDRNGFMTAYVDGVYSDQIDITNGAGQDLQTSHLFLIGRYQNNTGDGPHDSYIFNGTIDEVRISDTIRSAAWIATEYNNQFSPETFIKTIGDEVTLPVQLSSFSANLSSDFFVTLQWTTQSETGVQGFYIHRSTTNELASSLIVSPLIEATNTASQQHYQFTDAELGEIGTYYYWLNVQNLDGSLEYYGPTTIHYSDNVNQEIPNVPVADGFSSIYPNPFNPSTTISYVVTKDAEVSFAIYNHRGQIVRRFTEGYKTPGKWKVIWNGLDESGNTCTTGIYLIKMTAGKSSFTNKMVLMK